MNTTPTETNHINERMTNPGKFARTRCWQARIKEQMPAADNFPWWLAALIAALLVGGQMLVMWVSRAF